MSRKQIAQWWESERPRRFLALALLFPVGIALYFSLPAEPHWEWMLAMLLCFAAISAGLWRRHRLRLPITALFIVGLGMCWATMHTAWQDHTMLGRALTPRMVEGTVQDVERTERGLRLTLDAPTIRGLAPEQTPARIRLGLRLKQDAVPEFPAIGSRVALMAGLLPPMGPAMPHGFDFARYFYFRGIGAVGYGLPPWNVVQPAQEQGIAQGFANWRMRLTENIITQLGPRKGPIAAGLITGEDKAIQEADFEVLKVANLYHIIAISGGHMVVITGVVFLLLRWLTLCLPSGLRYRPEMKSAAAAATLVLVTGYLFVTGMPPSAVRAYVMIALVLLAVLLRRQVNPMRSLVLAALLMLAYDPSDLFEPGFQLSFVATLAIIALVERVVLQGQHGTPWRARIWRVVLASFLIAVVAEAATAPLVLAQFNQFASYGILANVVATPLVSLLMMPLVALYFLLLPLGLEGAALWALGYTITAMLWIAHTVASWPGAVHYLPLLPGWGVVAFVLGLVWFCIWQQRPRWLGVPLMLAGVGSLWLVQLPDLLVGPELKQIALRTPTGYALARGRADALVPELWAHALGEKQLPPMPKHDPLWRCDALGCVARIEGVSVAFPVQGMAVAEDCRMAGLLVTTLRSVRCGRQAMVVDGWQLRRTGTQAFWIDGKTIRREHSAMWQGQRPWSAQ